MNAISERMPNPPTRLQMVLISSEVLFFVVVWSPEVVVLDEAMVKELLTIGLDPLGFISIRQSLSPTSESTVLFTNHV